MSVVLLLLLLLLVLPFLSEEPEGREWNRSTTADEPGLPETRNDLTPVRKEEYNTPPRAHTTQIEGRGAQVEEEGIL